MDELEDRLRRRHGGRDDDHHDYEQGSDVLEPAVA